MIIQVQLINGVKVFFNGPLTINNLVAAFWSHYDNISDFFRVENHHSERYRTQIMTEDRALCDVKKNNFLQIARNISEFAGK
jgi:hypothetical protein